MYRTALLVTYLSALHFASALVSKPLRAGSRPGNTAALSSEPAWPAWFPSLHNKARPTNEQNRQTVDGNVGKGCGALVAASLGNVKAQLAVVNDTVLSAKGVIGLVNVSAANLLSAVNDSLATALSVLHGVHSTTAQVVFHEGNATRDSLDAIVAKVSPRLQELQMDVQNDVAKGVADLPAELNAFTNWRGEVLDEFSASLFKVSAMCADADRVLLERPSLDGVGGWLKCFLGTCASDGVNASLRTANSSVARLNTMYDDLNASSNRFLQQVLDQAKEGVSHINASLPSTLASMTSHMAAPVMAVVRMQAVSALNRVFVTINELLSDTIRESSREIDSEIVAAKSSQLPILYAAIANLQSSANEIRSEVAAATREVVSNDSGDSFNASAKPAPRTPGASNASNANATR